MTNVTLRQLRALIAIKTHGKIISAAKAVGLTAPAVTLQLRQLEEDAGIALFDRTAHGMRPTAAGLAFIDAAEAIVEQAAAFSMSELDAIRGVKKGTLTIGMVSTAEYFAAATDRRLHGARFPISTSSSWSANGPKPSPGSRITTSTSC